MIEILRSIAPELQEINRFNAIIGKQKRNAEQAYLQSKMLLSESLEGLDAGNDPIEIRDAIADVIVVAQGGCFIADAYQVGHIAGGALKLSSLDQIFTSSADSVAAAWRWMQKPDAEEKRHPYYHSLELTIRRCVAYAASNNIPLKADLQAVNASNFSKFCKTESEALETISAYTKKGVLTHFKVTGDDEYPLAVYTTNNTPFAPAGKLLKSINYQPPKFQ